MQESFKVNTKNELEAISFSILEREKLGSLGGGGGGGGGGGRFPGRKLCFHDMQYIQIPKVEYVSSLLLECQLPWDCFLAQEASFLV